MNLRIANCGLRIFPASDGENDPKSEIRNLKFFSAFTLIEIMVVVAIIGLVAAMGVPAMIKAMQKDGMRKALSDVQDVCFSARQQAIFSRQKTAVVIYPQDGRFAAEGAGGGANGINAHTGKVTSSTLPNSIKFAMVDVFRQDYAESEWARIFFYPDGTCDEAVLVLAGHGDQEKITLDYATGVPAISAVDK
ncbi:MAG TPA: type II secretion system protein [Verrucomicrobiae bacterium]